MSFLLAAHSSSLVFSNPRWLWPALVLGLAAIFLIALNYARLSLPQPWKALAITLKLLAFALLALALLEPVWVEEIPRDGANDLVILADNSRGLSIAGRGAALQAALHHDRPESPPAWLAGLRDSFRVQLYQFDRRLQRVEDFSKLDFSGDASSVVTSVKSLRSRYEKRPLAAMLVFTDGNATDSAAIDQVLESLRAAEAGGKKVPVFPILTGSPLSNVRDLSLRNVEVAQTSFEDAPVSIAVNAEARGAFPGGAEVFVVNEKGEELKKEPIIFAGTGETRTGAVRMKIAAAPPGVSFYRVGIREAGGDPKSPKPGELTEANNQRLVAVDRGRGPYRVLYVSGRPNWEFKFLRRALSEDAEVELVALIRLARREPKFEWRGRTGESGNPLFRGFGKDLPEETQNYDEPVLIRLNTRDETELRDGFPRDAETLFSSYRAIILDDVESDFFSAERQNLIESFVSLRGGTLLMLGGKESFQGGKWNNTPVARLLPVYLDRLGATGPMQFTTFNLSREGWLEPWMRLRDSQEEENKRLAYMPEFFSINKIPAIKPGASLLATVTDPEKRVVPAVVVQRYGEGRSGAVTVGDLWRWGMKDPDLQKDLGRMWRQLIRWSVAEAPGRLTQQVRQVSEGTLPVTRIEARARTKDFRPQDDATIKFELLRPGEKEALPISGEPSLEEAGSFSADYFLEASGGYRLKTVARDGEGLAIGELETGWAFNPEADEFLSLDPNRPLLQRIAEATGGEVIPLAEIDGIAGKLSKLNVPVTDARQRPLWHQPWIFLLALLCLGGEWAVRRWKGATL